MDKSMIINAFRESIISKKEFANAIYGDNPVPTNIADTLLTLSSFTFADLLIDVEGRLCIEFADEIMTLSNKTIGEIAEEIERIV